MSLSTSFIMGEIKDYCNGLLLFRSRAEWLVCFHESHANEKFKTA